MLCSQPACADPHAEVTTAGVEPRQARRERPRPRLRLTLRSTPPGAVTTVDGQPIGQTPLTHELVSDGREHEFTFSLAGYSTEHYRFPPIQDGVIHARLRPVPRAETAAR